MHSSQNVIWLLSLLVGLVGLGCSKSQTSADPPASSGASAPAITKLPVNFAKRTFDPASPPPEMRPLTGNENAECETNFLSSAIVGGNTRRTDATHGALTVTHVKMTLQLNIVIWVPLDVTARVLEHEEGHRQISEYYYQTADKIAENVAAKYIGKEVEVTGTDLNAESNKVLQQMAAEITAEYGRELNPEPTQLLFDTITDHSRNGADTSDAVAHAIKNVSIESPRAASPN